MDENTEPLRVQLAKMQRDLAYIKKAVDNLSSHEVRLDRVEQTQKRASKLGWFAFSTLGALALEAVWRKLSGH